MPNRESFARRWLEKCKLLSRLGLSTEMIQEMGRLAFRLKLPVAYTQYSDGWLYADNLLKRQQTISVRLSGIQRESDIQKGGFAQKPRFSTDFLCNRCTFCASGCSAQKVLPLWNFRSGHAPFVENTESEISTDYPNMPPDYSNISILDFIRATGRHWVALMSGGVVTVLIGIYAYFSGRNIPLCNYLKTRTGYKML
ncbi:MAG TPA: hypothetical protein VFD58_33345 [Blastocatellia bacterium]|nr:hypothetical protein [Blastocatellia bacterium]